MSSTLVLKELLPHGQHVNPAYVGGTAGESSAEERPDAMVYGTLSRFGKRQAASGTAQAFGWIKATYPDAIEYAGQKQALEGGIMVGAFFGVPFAMAGFGMMSFAAAFLWGDSVLASLVMIIGCLAMLAFGYWSLLFPLRHVWRTPRDLPIVFDRAHRKVYRMAQQRVPGLKGLIKPWPVVALAYDWDLVDAEHNSEFIGSANTARRLHRLLFVVRKSADDPTIIDSFEIGNGLAQVKRWWRPCTNTFAASWKNAVRTCPTATNRWTSAATTCPPGGKPAGAPAPGATATCGGGRTTSSCRGCTIFCWACLWAFCISFTRRGLNG
jgi:hypothetical protein